MKQQINSLTSTRGIAAMMIFIFHFGRWTYPLNNLLFILGKFNLAVNYFYILSGFVLYISYVNKYKISYFDFIIKRLGRIAPAYFLALFMSVMVVLFKHSINDRLTQDTIYSMFFIQSYFPSSALSPNIAAWSISVEMLFYVLFPFLLLLQKKNNILFNSISAFVFIITQLFVLIFISAKTSYKIPTYNPIIHINQFLIGMIGGYSFNKLNKMGKTSLPFSFILFVILSFILFIYKPDRILFDVGLIAPLFMCLIIYIAIKNPKFLNSKGLIFFGEISYGFYILQFPIYDISNEINTKYIHWGAQLFFVFSFFILCITAVISYFLVEQPIRRIINIILKN